MADNKQSKIVDVPTVQEVYANQFISAGFDAHHRDPLGSLQLAEEDFAWITLKLMEAAEIHCGGRIVSVLEGGYDLQGLGASAGIHVQALMRGNADTQDQDLEDNEDEF